MNIGVHVSFPIRVFIFSRALLIVGAHLLLAFRNHLGWKEMASLVTVAAHMLACIR